MTRGKMILINKDKFNGKNVMNITCEFNGDMYISWHGKLVIFNLEKVKNFEEFRKFIDFFDSMFFQYKNRQYSDYYLISYEEIKENTINLQDNYIENWFSDYLYFKNVCGEDINILCEINNKKETITIKNGEIKVFNFGQLVNYKKELIEILKGE